MLKGFFSVPRELSNTEDIYFNIGESQYDLGFLENLQKTLEKNAIQDLSGHELDFVFRFYSSDSQQEKTIVVTPKWFAEGKKFEYKQSPVFKFNEDSLKLLRNLYMYWIKRGQVLVRTPDYVSQDESRGMKPIMLITPPSVSIDGFKGPTIFALYPYDENLFNCYDVLVLYHGKEKESSMNKEASLSFLNESHVVNPVHLRNYSSSKINTMSGENPIEKMIRVAIATENAISGRMVSESTTEFFDDAEIGLDDIENSAENLSKIRIEQFSRDVDALIKDAREVLQNANREKGKLQPVTKSK